MRLDFHKLTIADREAVQAVSLRAGRRNCNFTFANLLGWQGWFGTEVCVLKDAVVLRFNMEGERAYMLCMQGVPSCELLQALCEDCNQKLILLGLEDDAALQLQQNACHDGELGRQVHILDDPGDLLKCASQHKLMPAPDRTYGILSV